MRSRRLIKIGGVELAVFIDDGIADRLSAVKQKITGKKRQGPGDRAVVREDPAALSPEQRAIYDRIAGTEWYHTIDLGHGVVTPGFFDHRPVLSHYHLPDSLAGKRVLDVATFDGFWALEFEKRGAKEVVAVDLAKVSDIDLAPSVRARMSREELETALGSGFKLAKEILGSKVHREVISVYDLSPERIGTFDFVFCGDLLIHLQNPVRALECIRGVTADTAYFVELSDPSMQRTGPYKLLNYQGGKTDHVWWNFGEGTLGQMIGDAGFEQVEELDRFELIPRGHTWSPPHVLYRTTTSAER